MRFQCPKHESKYTPNGTFTSGRATRNMDRLNIRHDGDMLAVDLSHMLKSDKDPAGGKVVTYNKWPLYTYVADSAAGQANGEGVNANGGRWYVISPAGKLVKHRQ
jgi:hypothetical protein